jgi:hypothetical protein
MAQLQSIIAQIARVLSITSLDVYVFFVVLVIVGIIAATGLARIYSTFFGTVLGIGIFVLFSTILSPEYQTPETTSFISTFAKTFIGSSVYLIFILTLLVPINGGIIVTLPKNPIEKIFQTVVLSIGLVLFLVAVFLWLVEKSYIFSHTDSFFASVKKLSSYSELQGSLLFTFVSSHLPTIIILSIGFIIYKLLFADIVNALIASLITSLRKQKIAAWSGVHEEEDHGWHEEEHEEAHEEDHGWHDPHGWWHGHH